LDEAEFAQIKEHPGKGAKILGGLKGIPGIVKGARWHHERFDGQGYPDGLRGLDIPVEARIIAVADAYDAMTSNRSYRRGMEQSKVREQIEKGKGTQFDPRFADIMIAMIDEDKDYDMRETDQ
jgi:putative two-component system response regulator